MKNCGRIARHDLSNEIEIINGCESLDDVEQCIRFFLMRLILDESISDETVRDDVRSLLPHCYQAVRRLEGGSVS